MTKQESEVLEKFGSEEVKSAKLFRVWHKVEKAEKDFLDKLTEEQKALYENYRSIEMERDSIQIDEAVLFGFNYAKSWFQELLGIKRENDN